MALATKNIGMLKKSVKKREEKKKVHETKKREFINKEL